MRFLNIAAAFGLTTLIVYALVIGKFLLLPLVVAVLLWYFLIRLGEVYGHLTLGHFQLPHRVALVLAFATVYGVIYLVSTIVGNSLQAVVVEAPKYQDKFNELVNYVNSLLGEQMVNRDQLMANLSVTDVISRLALALSGIAGDLGLIAVYVLFLLMEQRSFDAKLRALCPTEQRYQETRVLFRRIATEVDTYLWIKTLVSLLTGALTFAVLSLFQVDFAGFWGLLTFLFNYIPYIGSIVAVALAVLVSLVQFTNPATALFLGTLLIGIQFGVGNVLEPHLMGRSLNLSPIVILLSLAFWGSIWGVWGMVLCVPAMVIINIVLAHFPQTRPVAILLSSDGRVYFAERADNAKTASDA
ncbi:MAG: AI-2E family transporter [Candidatus Competibacterales bacterium]